MEAGRILCVLFMYIRKCPLKKLQKKAHDVIQQLNVKFLLSFSRDTGEEHTFTLPLA